jgi:hypothetical protein
MRGCARGCTPLQERDERWQSLAIDQLGVSRSVLQLYLMHGDSVSLANLISIAQEIFLCHSENGDWSLYYGFSLRTLEMASRFNAQGTIPELQHGVCDLWNDLFAPHRMTTILTPGRPPSECLKCFRKRLHRLA